MSLQEIIEEVRALSVEERKQLVMAIIDTFADEKPEKRSILEFAGVGAEMWDDR